MIEFGALLPGYGGDQSGYETDLRGETLARGLPD